MKKYYRGIFFIIIVGACMLSIISTCQRDVPVTENKNKAIIDSLHKENKLLKDMEVFKNQKIDSLVSMIDSVKNIRVESLIGYKKVKEKVKKDIKQNACDTIKLIELYDELTQSCDSVISAFSLESSIKDSTISALFDIRDIKSKQLTNKEEECNVLMNENKSLNKKLRNQKIINKITTAGAAFISAILIYSSLK